MALKYLYAPSGVQAGTAYGVLPNSANADFSSFARSSAGSRVDENGLINTGLGLGSEEVVNGDFDSASNWEVSVATISNGRAIFISATNAYSYVRQVGVLTQNKEYEVTINLTVNSGSGIKFQDGSGTTFSVISESGIHTRRFTATTTNSTFVMAREFDSGGYDMYVESVSVREITEVNTNVPRLDYTDGGCPSLLLEPQSTNLFQYSEDFSQSYWVRTGSYDIVYENKLNPKGELGYYKLTGSGQLRTNAISVGTSVNDFTLSILVKNIDSDSIRLDVSDSSSGDAYIDFFFATETFGTPVDGGAWTNAKGSFIKLKNGWYYVSLTATKNAGGGVISKIIYENDSVALFAAQVEQQSYATSYIPNYGTAAGVTRSADTGGSTEDISSVVNSQEGTFMFEGSFSDQGLKVSLNSSTTTFSNRISIRTMSDTQFRIDYYAGAVGLQALFDVSSTKDNAKIAIKWISGSLVVYHNGTEVVDVTNIADFSPNILNRISFSNADTTSNKFKGRAKQFRVYDEYLSDAEMVKLTTL